MSKHSSPATGAGELTLETGIEAFQSSPEFRGPVEHLDGRHCNDHFAHIHETAEEKLNAAIPFIRHGLDRGERIAYVINQSNEADVRAALREAGIDVAAAVDSGALQFYTVEETYLRGGTFDPDEMIEFYADATAAAAEDFEALRLVAEMTWIDAADATVEDLMEYEQKINDLFDHEPVLAICQYDRNQFAPEVIRDVVHTHPHLIYNGAACHNFYYTPPEAFFSDEAPERENDRMLRTLHERTVAKNGLRRHEQFIRECYEITADPTLDFETKLEQLLTLASDRMELEAAGLTYLPEQGGEFLNEYTIGYGNDTDGALWTDPSEGCYCREVIQNDAPVGKHDVRGTEWETDDIHQEHGLSCYLGMKVMNGSTPYGTVWVGSTTPRDRAFTETERTCLELIGQWVSYELERRDHGAAQEQLYTITSDPDRDFEEKLDALFDLGRDRFNADIGGMTKVDHDADMLEVEYVSGDHLSYEPGLRFPVSETFCETAITTGEEVSIVDPDADGLADRPVHSEHGFETYLGTHIEVDGDYDRTFFFMSEKSRPTEYTDGEQTFLRLMGQWIEYELERQQRERNLRERTEHLNALIETTPECIKTVAEDGTLLQMNPAGLEMVEAPEEAVVTGENVYDLIAPEHREKFTAFNERICSGERGTLEFDIIGLEGTRRHMKSHAAPLTRPDGETVHVAVTHDVTEQKERKAELERALDLLAKTERVADVGGWELDPDTKDVFWTDHHYELKDVDGDAEPPLDETIAMYHEADQPVIEDAVKAAIDTGESFDLEVRLQPTASDDVRWLRLQGVPETEAGEVESIRGAAQDITERKERESELRQTKDRFETVFEQSDDGIYIIDPDADEFVAVNPKAAEMNGYTREELLSLAPSDLLPDERGQFHAFLNEAQQQGSAWSEDLHCRHKDGHDIPAEITASPITLNGRDLVLALVRHIEERKTHERYQRDLYEITADTELDTDEKIKCMLAVGRERLGLPVGMLNRDIGDAVEIEQMHGSLPMLKEGAQSSPESEYYCRRVIDTGEPATVADAAAAGWDCDPMYEAADLEAYAGVPVTVGGAVYGTMSFADTAPREAPFTEAEQAFLDLMGQCVSYELEQAKRETRLQALSTLGRELLDTETPEEVAEQAIEIADDTFENQMVAIGLYDEETGDLRLTATTEAAADLPMKTLIEQGDGIGWQAFVSSDPQRVPAPFDTGDTAAGTEVSEAVGHPLGTHGVVLVGSTRPNGFHHGDAEAMQTAVANLHAALDRADRERKLQDREDTLEDQNETLARLNRINDTIRSVDQCLVEASSRAEIEQVVCEELANTGPYELAWIGKQTSATSEITPIEWAGSDKGYLDSITITADDSPEGCGPAGRAVKTGDPHVVNNVLTDESFEPWRQAALNRGYHATAALPITYDNSHYGVLNLYAGQPGVFDDLEREVLAELSKTIGHAINAIESKKALISDEVTELEFAIADSNLEIVEMVRELECTFSLKRLVPRSDGNIQAFFAVREAATADVLDFESHLPVDELHVVSETDDNSPTVFEAVLTNESLSASVLDHGGQLRQIKAENGTAVITIHLAPDAEVREFVETIQLKYPDSELQAQRTKNVSQRTGLEFATALTEEMTDRQFEVLQTAYFSGYFEEPREQNAGEIADTLDIAQPTFTSHLRAATRKLNRRLFEDELAVE